MKQRVCAIALLISFTYLSSCCSIIHGTHQGVPINSNPNAADVTVDCGEGVTNAGVTPVTVNLKRKPEVCKVTLKKEGYEDASIAFAKSVSGWVWGNLFFGGLIGLIVDVADGAMYNRVPETPPTVSLNKK